MKRNYTRVDLIQNYDIRDVCIDCNGYYVKAYLELVYDESVSYGLEGMG